MKSQLLSSSHTLSIPIFSQNLSLPNSPQSSNLFFKTSTFFPLFSSKKHYHNSRFCILDCSIKAQSNPNFITEDILPVQQNDPTNHWVLLELKNTNLPPFVSSLCSMFSFSDQVFFLITFIAFTTCAAFVSFVAAAVPTLYAMGRTANSFAKLADAAREELPSTMAAVRLSGMEVSDLTLELSDLSQEISEGVNKSAQAVQAAKVGIQQIGARAREQTILMIEERANLPAISLRMVVSGAANKTSRAVGRATRTFLNMISGEESNSKEIG